MRSGTRSEILKNKPNTRTSHISHTFLKTVHAGREKVISRKWRSETEKAVRLLGTPVFLIYFFNKGSVQKCAEHFFERSPY
jgi:hypothetical protein